jgi:hypothetical protein
MTTPHIVTDVNIGDGQQFTALPTHYNQRMIPRKARHHHPSRFSSLSHAPVRCLTKYLLLASLEWKESPPQPQKRQSRSSLVQLALAPANPQPSRVLLPSSLIAHPLSTTVECPSVSPLTLHHPLLPPPSPLLPTQPHVRPRRPLDSHGL